MKTKKQKKAKKMSASRRKLVAASKKVLVGRSVKPKKKKVTAVLAKPEFYRVELEVMSRAADNTVQYTYAPFVKGHEQVEEAAANLIMEEMKAMGIGGRIIHLDGTPDGKITTTWGSVERTAAAEKVEQAALEGAGK